MIVAMLTAAAAAAALWLPDPAAQTAGGRLLGPSWAHPFGTDELRRDVAARTFAGLRASILTVTAAVVPGALAGVAAGLAAAGLGRWADGLLMRAIDAWLAFPGLLIALAVLAVTGPGRFGVGLTLFLFTVPSFARLARAQARSELAREYVVAARALGASRLRVMTHHVARNAWDPLLTHFALMLAVALFIESALSFLGLGVQAPAPSLGGMVNASRQYLRESPAYLLGPAAVLACIVLSLNLLVDALQDAFSGRAGGITRR
jgi:peptide/nickel transport system permease protein